MSDSLEPSGAGTQEVEALVRRAVAERLDPVHTQLATVGRALAILAERVPQPQLVSELSRRVDALAARLDDVAPPGSSLASLERRVEDGLADVGARLSEASGAELPLALHEPGEPSDGMKMAADLRRLVATAVDQTVDRLRPIEEAAAADVSRLLEKVEALEASLALDSDARRSQTEELRQALAVVVSHAVAKVEEVRRVDAASILERIAALEAPLQQEAAERRAQADDLSQAIAAALEQGVAQIERAVSTDRARLLEGLTALEIPLSPQGETSTVHAEDLRSSLERALAQIEAARAADAARILERIAALEGPLAHQADTGQAALENLRTTIAGTVEQAVEQAVAQVEAARAADAAALEGALAKLEATRASESSGLLEQVSALAEAVTRDRQAREALAEDLRTGVAATVAQALAEVEAARTADASRVLGRIVALEEPLTRDAVVRQAQLDDLRQTVATAIEQAVGRIEDGRSGDAAGMVEQITALAAAVEAEGKRRNEQASAMLTTVDERLGALHLAGTETVVQSESRIVEKLEAITADRLQAPLARIDERLDALHRTDTDAAGQSEGRIVERLEAIIADHGRTLLARIDERISSITDLEAIPVMVAAEVKDATAAALTSQVEPLVGRLVEAIDTLAHEGGRIEAMARGQAGETRAIEERVAAMLTQVAERAESAVDHSRARIAEGQVALGARFDAFKGEVLGSVAAATDGLETRLAESVEALRTAGAHQNGALLDAVTRSSQQLSEGMVELRAALLDSGTDSMTRGQQSERLAERLESLRAAVEAIRHDAQLQALVVEQVAARDAQVAAIEAVSARIDEVGPVVARALLSEVERATRAANAAEEAVASLQPDQLRAVLAEASKRAAGEIEAASRRLDETMAILADQVVEGVSSLPIDDLRASQTVLREAVQDGAHKAELAVIDIRGLRDRLTPHLVALADATTRRAEADQAGFDAVLARLDQLLAASQVLKPESGPGPVFGR